MRGKLEFAAKPGGTIIKLVNGQLATDVVGGKALVAAAAAVGWTGHYVVYNGTIQDLNAKWQQAISEHPTAIVSSGPPAAAVSQVLAASKKAGIITDLLGATDTPGNGNDLNGVTLGYQSFSQEGPAEFSLR